MSGPDTETTKDQPEKTPRRKRSLRKVTDMTGVYSLTFSRGSAVVLLDCMNSVMRGREKVVDSIHFKKVNDRYAELFARMTACWQRVINLISPQGQFWRISDCHRYDQAREQ